jgi:CBS-domain-containing membrane protein
MTTAREIMTANAECVRDYESILVAAEKMTAHKVGALPICGSDDRLKALPTD